MGLYSLPLVLLLGFFVTIVEIIRHKTRDRIDFLLGANTVYLICFSIAPVFLLTSDLSNLPHMGWLLKNPFESSIFLYASVLGIIGYISILSGYYLSVLFEGRGAVQECRSILLESYEIPDKLLLVAGSMIFLVGFSSLIIYVNSIGGLVMSIRYADAFRGNEPPIITKWGFLKSVAPLIQTSSYFFYALTKSVKGLVKKYYVWVMLFLSFNMTIYLLYHNAGRLSMVTYFLVFLMAKCFEKGKFATRLILLCGLVAVLFILFGDSMFMIFIRKGAVLDAFNRYRSSPDVIFKLILSEFSFPFATLGNAVDALNYSINMRFFYDIPLAFFYLIPKRMFNIKLPPGLSDLNTTMFHTTGAIPVDIVSFGYYSMGVAGVMLTCYVFGIVIKVLDVRLRDVRKPILAVFKAAWIINLSFVVMYGDPKQFVKGNFSLLVATTVLILIMIKEKRKIQVRGIQDE